MALVILIILGAAAYTDIRWGIIPNAIIVTALIIALWGICCTGVWKPGLFGLLIASTLLIPCYFEQLGEGDVKLFMVLGLLMGPGIIVLMAASLVLGGACHFLRRTFFGKADPIPLAPFMLAGYLLLGGVVIAGKIA